MFSFPWRSEDRVGIPGKVFLFLLVDLYCNNFINILQKIFNHTTMTLVWINLFYDVIIQMKIHDFNITLSPTSYI